MRRLFLLIASVLCSTALAFGQGTAATAIPITINQSGAPIPSVLVTVCTTNPGTGTCAVKVTTYTDITLGTACSGTLKLLNNLSAPSVGSGCSNPGFSDGLGNVMVFAAGGASWCQFSGSGLTTYSQPCIFPSGAGGTPGGSPGQPQFNNAGVFGGMSGFTTAGVGYTAGPTGFIDLTSAPPLSGLKWPSAAGAAPTTANTYAWDSTAIQPVYGDGSNTRKVMALSGATPTSGNCTKFVVSGTNVLIQDAGAACVAPSAIPTQVVQSGLIGEYRMLPTETPASLVDYSGSGNNATGTVGTAPTIIAGTGGVQFNGNGAISLPAALNSALTVQFVAGFQFTGAGQYNALIAGGPSAPTNCPQFFLDNQHNVTNVGTNYHFESWNTNFNGTWRYTLQGSALVTWEIGNGVADSIAINNGSLLGGSGSGSLQLSAGNYQLGGWTGGGGNCPSVSTYYTGQIYYVVVYNRKLTQTEINLNNQFLQQVMFARGQTLALASTSITDQLILDGDSIIGLVPNSAMSFPTPVNVYNLSASGFKITDLVTDAPFAVDPYYQTAANRELDLMWAGTNDAGGGTCSGSGQCTVNYLNGYCRARHQRGFTCGVVTMMDRTGVATFKNAYNALIRQYWTTFADFLVDVAADPLMGCDGCNANTTYFSAGLHPTTAAADNILAQHIQRGINRYYGNNDWSTATTYVAAAPAATAITAASEAGNTVTITSTLNPPVHSCVVIAGVTPAAYNNLSGECWNVLTTAAGNFTFFHFQTGLGAGTVFGTASVPLQKDADKYIILNYGAGSFTLQPCGGYTGQRLYIKNVNAASSTVTAFGNDLIDGAATATVAQNATLILQGMLVTPATPVCSWVKVQNN